MLVLPVSTTSELSANVLTFREPLILTADVLVLDAFLTLVLDMIPVAMLFPANVISLIAGNSKVDSSDVITEDETALSIFVSAKCVACKGCTLNTTAHIRHTAPAQWRKSKSFFIFIRLFSCYLNAQAAPTQGEYRLLGGSYLIYLFLSAAADR